MGIYYRLSQFWQNVTAQQLSQPDRDEIANVLSEDEQTLFRQMSVSDQQHALRVYRLLKAVGQTDRNLLAAALLHDVGKIRVNLTVWDRTLAVLGETFVPEKAVVWGRADGNGWERAFVVREQHAAWGAALAEAAGSSPGAVDLIRRHQDLLPVDGGAEDSMLALLQWADNQS